MSNHITRTQITVGVPEPTPATLHELAARNLHLQDLMARGDGFYEAYRREHDIPTPAEHVEFEGTIVSIDSRQFVVSAGDDRLTINSMLWRTFPEAEIGSRVRGSLNYINGSTSHRHLKIEVLA